jgi:hypothetical protein
MIYHNKHQTEKLFARITRLLLVRLRPVGTGAVRKSVYVFSHAQLR